jgi:hypothetical protein
MRIFKPLSGISKSSGLFVVVFALLLPASALAQATRTWVSGTGDDVNPCSRTAPCKTFAGAISKTASGGEIDAQDPGGFGTLTITKPITIDGGGGQVASILASGTPGITINVPAGAGGVNIQNLRFDGAGSGTVGIRIVSADTVHLQDVQIFNNTGPGIDLTTAGKTRLLLADSSVFQNRGAGLMVAPASGGKDKATLDNDEIDDNQCGLVASSQGETNGFTTNCGAGSGSGGTATLEAYRTGDSDNNDAGVLSNGATAVAGIGGDEVTGNVTGLEELAGGSLSSFGDNYVIGNNTNGSPSATATKTSKPRSSKAKRSHSTRRRIRFRRSWR